VQHSPGKAEERNSWRAFREGFAAFWEQLLCSISNARRALLRGHKTDYAVIRLDHELSERTPDVPWYYAYLPGYRIPLSLEYLHDALKRIAHDPDLRGVIFLIKGPTLSLAQAQSMNALFDRFRRWDSHYRRMGSPPKQIIVHLEQTSAATYVLAAAADRITMPPLTT
jgi:protease-4